MPHTLAGQNSQQMATNYNSPSDSVDSEEDYFSAEEDIDYENGNIFNQNNIIQGFVSAFSCIFLAGKLV